MPATAQVCRHCAEVVNGKNLATHIHRRHPEIVSTRRVSTLSSSSATSRVSSAERNPRATVACVELMELCEPRLFAAGSTSITADDIHDATLCMIRRNDGCNLPAMSQYPADWHMLIIVAAITAVQKASVMHGDTLLQGDDERMQWARRTHVPDWGTVSVPSNQAVNLQMMKRFLQPSHPLPIMLIRTIH